MTIHEGNATPGAAVLSGDVTIPQLVKKVVPAVVSIDVKAGGEEDEGTGMIITSNGEVITNNHVIELFTQNGGGTITVTQYGQKKSEPATLIGYNAQQDMALLKINNVSNLPTVTFGSSAKTRGGRRRGGHRQRLGLAAGTPDGDPGHRLRARPFGHRRRGRDRRRRTCRTSSRPTPPSIPATPAVPSSIPPARSSA